MKCIKLMLLINFLYCFCAYGITGNEILSATGIKAGLCVHIGCGDGIITSQLHNNGKILVSACAQNVTSWKATQDMIQKNGLYGMVSVMFPLSLKQLPYMSNTVTLLVVDLDVLGASGPSLDEMKRVTAPIGVIYYMQGGQWHLERKALTQGMDEWRYQYHGPNGNPVSNDEYAGPNCTRVRFVNSVSNPDKIHILSAGKLVYKSYEKKIICRDAFTGVPIWVKTNNFKFYPSADGGENLYIVDSIGKTPKIWNIHTGEVTGSLDEVGVISPLYNQASKGPSIGHIQIAGNSLLITNGNKLFSINRTTKAKNWVYTSKDSAVSFMVSDTINGRIFLTEGPADQQIGGTRWDGAPVSAIVCIGANDGIEKWRCNSFVGKGGGTRKYPGVTQLLYTSGNVYMFEGMGILVAYGDPYLCRVDANTGELKWQIHYQDKISQFDERRFNGDAGSFAGVNYSGTSYWDKSSTTFDIEPVYKSNQYWGQILMTWDDRPYIGVHNDLRRYSVEKGLRDPAFVGFCDAGQCNRGLATQKYYWTAGMNFMDRNGNHTRTFITRSSCAVGGIPGYGALYFNTGWCTCFNSLRGVLSLSPDPLPTTVANDKRVDKTALLASADVKPSSFTSSNLLVQDWTNNGQVVTAATSGTVSSGNLTIQANIHQQRVEAKNGSIVVWSFLAGARVPMTPIVSNGKCYFGSHDGWVYCLDASTGALQWRFLAAPSEEQIVSYSQIESNWPVRGVALVNGTLYCVAGRQAETNGGVYVWGLDPASGTIIWNTRLYSPPMHSTAPFSKITVNLGTNAKGITGPIFSGENADGSLTISSWSKAWNGGYSVSGGLALDLTNWNGKIIDPRTTTVVDAIKKSSSTAAKQNGAQISIRCWNQSIQINSQRIIKSAQIVNGSGKLIYSNKNGTNKILRISRIQNGFYIIKTRLDNGQMNEALLLIP